MTLSTVALLWGALAGPLSGQSTPPEGQSVRHPGHLMATRDSLEALEQRLGSGAAGDSVRDRLTRGDFTAGDRIHLLVDSEPQLSDTFVVGGGQELMLPNIGAVSLHGVLRSELQGFMSEKIGLYLRAPVVRAYPLIRVSVVGEVAKPGFLLIPPSAVVSDVLTAAGGPTREALAGDMVVVRAGKTLIDKHALWQAFQEGRTLDEIGLQSGDVFVVPIQKESNVYQSLRLVAVILAIPISLYTLAHIWSH